MRIIRGRYKGRRITPDSSFSARPTTDFAKENIFNVLENYLDFEGLHVLDLFSGTGGIGYEFASRGAAEVVSVEANFHHYSFIRRTITELGIETMRVYKKDVFVACRKLKGRSFDMIFADPPYNLDRIMEIPELIFDNELLAEGGILVVEHPSTVKYDTNPHFMEHRLYGSVNFSLFRNS